MARRLDASEPGFEAAFEALIAARHGEADVAGDVAAIIADVRARGDAAVIDYTRQFDRLSVAGNCRMCLVEMEKAPKPIASCAMLATSSGVIVRGPERPRNRSAPTIASLSEPWKPSRLVCSANHSLATLRLSRPR